MLSTWIKICGMTSSIAVNTAIDAGVNAVGFVFAPSKRQVSAQQAREYAASVPTHVARIAVMQHPAQSLVDEVLQIFKPDMLQTDWEDIAGLTLPSQLQVLPVLRASKSLPNGLPPRFLFEGPVSGTGETADWQLAAELATQGELILAGGLHPANVGDAMAQVRPFGVDVSSGVESAPGVKDLHKIVEFVNAARQARIREAGVL
jgi:phosphoribosylanthranilate isomerase